MQQARRFRQLGIVEPTLNLANVGIMYEFNVFQSNLS